MFTSLIKGDEVRYGRQVYLDALSKKVIDEFADTPLSEKMLIQLNDGSVPIFPMTARQVVESYKNNGEFPFALRLVNDETCIGSCRLADIDWQARRAQLFIGIVNEAYFTPEMLTDVLQTVLQFAYWEANLNRIAVHCVEDHVLMQAALEQVGFTNEGRFRQEAYRNGRYLDKIIFSILQCEWSKTNTPEIERWST